MFRGYHRVRHNSDNRISLDKYEFIWNLHWSAGAFSYVREVNIVTSSIIFYTDNTVHQVIIWVLYFDVWSSFELSAVNCLSGNNNNKKKVQNIFPGEGGGTSLEIYTYAVHVWSEYWSKLCFPHVIEFMVEKNEHPSTRRARPCVCVCACSDQPRKRSFTCWRKANPVNDFFFPRAIRWFCLVSRS